MGYNSDYIFYPGEYVEHEGEIGQVMWEDSDGYLVQFPDDTVDWLSGSTIHPDRHFWIMRMSHW